MENKEEYLEKFNDEYPFSNDPSLERIKIEQFLSEALDAQRKSDVKEFIKIVENRFAHQPETGVFFEGYYVRKENWKKIKSELKRNED